MRELVRMHWFDNNKEVLERTRTSKWEVRTTRGRQSQSKTLGFQIGEQRLERILSGKSISFPPPIDVDTSIQDSERAVSGLLDPGGPPSVGTSVGNLDL